MTRFGSVPLQAVILAYGVPAKQTFAPAKRVQSPRTAEVQVTQQNLSLDNVLHNDVDEPERDDDALGDERLVPLPSPWTDPVSQHDNPLFSLWIRDESRGGML